MDPDVDRCFINHNYYLFMIFMLVTDTEMMSERERLQPMYLNIFTYSLSVVVMLERFSGL